MFVQNAEKGLKGIESMAYCLSGGKAEKCEYINECTINAYCGKYKGEDEYIKGMVCTGGLMTEESLCKRDDRILIEMIHKLKEKGYEESEITVELVKKELEETYNLPGYGDNEG